MQNNLFQGNTSSPVTQLTVTPVHYAVDYLAMS